MPQLSHMVYFTLQDDSEVKIWELVNACKKYLDDHPGVVYFSVGTLNKELARPVNDRGYQVTLNVVFDSRASHDLYQVAPRHLEFMANQIMVSSIIGFIFLKSFNAWSVLISLPSSCCDQAALYTVEKSAACFSS